MSTRQRGRGCRRVPGQMNGTEKLYAETLEAMRLKGEVAEYLFDAVKLRLADNTFYTPDFFVMTAAGLIEFHEVKGFWEDDARVKIKVAADKYPFRFVAVTKRAKKHGGGWNTEEF